MTFTVSRDGVAFAVTAHAQLEDADAVDAVAPPAPVGLAIAGATDEAVTISWSASEDRGTAYAYGVGGTDEAGNAGPSSAVQSVEATSGTARYRVLVDGTQAAAVDTTSLELRGLDRRLRHRLMVLAVDAAGNVSPESAVLEVGDDLVPARPTGLEAESPTRRAPLLSWSAVDGAEVYTVLRDGEEVGTTAETTFADAQLDADGSYRYTVRAAGPAGLPSPPSEPLDVVRDTVAPDASIVSSPQEITGASATLELTSDDPAAQLLCGIDGSRPLVPCETPWLLSHLADGEHAVEVGAVDAAGNEDATPASAAFETDGTPPAAPTLDVVVDESLAKGSLRGRVAITAVPGDGAVRVVVTSGDRTILDGDGGTVADEVMDDEELTYTAVSYDAAGNVSDVTTRRVRTPDRTPPAPPILTADGSTLPVALAWSGEDGATARIARDGGDPIVTRERALVDRDAVDALFDRAVQAFGRVDLLFNNAALFDMAPLLDSDLRMYERLFDVNVKGMFFVMQTVLARLVACGRKGSIINICSTYGLNGPDQRIYIKDGKRVAFKPVYYTTTKAGVMGFTKYLAAYYAETEIRVNALTPGGVFNNHEEYFVKNYSAKTILGRMAKKDEMNGALLFLASDASSYMTGNNVIVDGGWTAW